MSPAVIAAEEIQWQISVVLIVGVNESARLMTVQRIVCGIHIRQDLSAARCVVGGGRCEFKSIERVSCGEYSASIGGCGGRWILPSAGWSHQ